MKSKKNNDNEERWEKERKGEKRREKKERKGERKRKKTKVGGERKREKEGKRENKNVKECTDSSKNAFDSEYVSWETFLKNEKRKQKS